MTAADHARVSMIQEGRHREIVWYVVDAAWLRRWKDFTEIGSDSPAPGPIPNSRLVDKAGVAHAGLWAKKHYRCLGELAWLALFKIYGGGPELRRIKPDIYADIPSGLAALSYPLTARVYRTEGNAAPNPSNRFEKNEEEDTASVGVVSETEAPRGGREEPPATARSPNRGLTTLQARMRGKKTARGGLTFRDRSHSEPGKASGGTPSPTPAISNPPMMTARTRDVYASTGLFTQRGGSDPLVSPRSISSYPTETETDSDYTGTLGSHTGGTTPGKSAAAAVMTARARVREKVLATPRGQRHGMRTPRGDPLRTRARHWGPPGTARGAPPAEFVRSSSAEFDTPGRKPTQRAVASGSLTARLVEEKGGAAPGFARRAAERVATVPKLVSMPLFGVATTGTIPGLDLEGHGIANQVPPAALINPQSDL